jgi:hypothetical protein
LRTRHHLLIAFASVALLALLGCQQDGIETHRVDYHEPPPPPEEKVRLLGAMIPHGENTWFFKLVGKLDVIEAQRNAFEKFVRSVEFDRRGEAIWALPEGWKRLPDDPRRYATIQVADKDDAPELTVNKFGDGPKTQSRLENVARWGRLDVGVRVGWNDLGQYVRDDTTGAGVPFTFVDMKGPGGTGGGMKPPMPGGKDAHAADETLGYKLPEGWKEVAPGGGQFGPLVAIKVEEGSRSVLITLSKLMGDGGGILKNVNRWRVDQLGLSPLKDNQLRDAVKVLDVGGGIAAYVDFTGPGKPAGKEDRRILGLVVPRGGQTWFIKMDGPADLVGGQKAAFEQFAGSVKFDGGKGG